MGQQIRAIVQHLQDPLDSKAEYLLFAADRAQHIAQLVMPHLQQNGLVLSDRMADSSLVYQGFGRGLDIDILRTINRWAMHGIAPDVVLYVQVPLQTAFERIAQRPGKKSRFEQEQQAFTKRLHKGFQTIFANRDDVIRLDGTQDELTVAQDAFEKIVAWLETNNALK